MGPKTLKTRQQKALDGGSGIFCKQIAESLVILKKWGLEGKYIFYRKICLVDFLLKYRFLDFDSSSLAKANQLFKKVLELDSKRVDSYTNLGKAFLDNGNI